MSSATLLEFILVHLVHRVVYVHANLLVCACVLICRAGSRSASASYVCAVQQIRRTPHSMCAPHMPSLLPPPSLLKARCKLFDFAKQTDVTSQIDISTVQQSGWDATEWSSALRQTWEVRSYQHRSGRKNQYLFSRHSKQPDHQVSFTMQSLYLVPTYTWLLLQLNTGVRVVKAISRQPYCLVPIR